MHDMITVNGIVNGILSEQCSNRIYIASSWGLGVGLLRMNCIIISMQSINLKAQNQSCATLLCYRNMQSKKCLNKSSLMK